jgi:hypothetical protein
VPGLLVLLRTEATRRGIRLHPLHTVFHVAQRRSHRVGITDTTNVSLWKVIKIGCVRPCGNSNEVDRQGARSPRRARVPITRAVSKRGGLHVTIAAGEFANLPDRVRELGRCQRLSGGANPGGLCKDAFERAQPCLDLVAAYSPPAATHCCSWYRPSFRVGERYVAAPRGPA